MRKFLTMLALAGATLLVGVSSYAIAKTNMATTSRVQNLGPFIALQSNTDSLGAPAGGVGGLVKLYVAKSSDTLKVGDAVFFDTLNAVSKSTTLANYTKFAGVVVGGRSTGMGASIAAADVGTTAALPNRPVWVLYSGRAFMQVDTSVAGLTAGTGVVPSNFNAGRIRARTSAIDSLYRVFGRSINGGAASATVLIEVRAK